MPSHDKICRPSAHFSTPSQALLGINELQKQESENAVNVLAPGTRSVHASSIQPLFLSFLSNLGQSYMQNPTSRICKSCVVSTVRCHASSSNSCTAEFIQELCRIIPPNQQHQHSEGNAFNHDFVLCICRTCFGQEGGSGVYSCCNLEPACISLAKFRKHDEVHALLPCSIQRRCCGDSSSLHRDFPKTMRHAM